MIGRPHPDHNFNVNFFVARPFLELIKREAFVRYIHMGRNDWNAAVILFVILCCGVFPSADGAGAPTNPDAEKQIRLSRQHLQTGDYDAAAECAETAVALAPGNSHYQMVLGDAYGMIVRDASIFTKMSWARKCLAAYQQAVKLDPANLDARQRLMSYYLQAPGIAGGSEDKAHAQAEEIRKRDPLAGHMAWGTIHRSRKDFTAAQLEYRQALDIQPDDKQANIMFGYVSLRLSQYAPAGEAFRKVRAIDADDPNGLLFTGEIAGRTGQDLEDGRHCLERFLQLQVKARKTSLAEAYYWLGVILEKQGQRPAARTEYQAALSLDSKNSDYKQAVKKLGR